MEIKLPEQYKETMKRLLGQDFKAYEDSFLREPYGGIRINTLKITPKDWEKISPYGMERVPWTENGYYYNPRLKPARHPYYFAGLYYLQEPSAMLPANVLAVKPGDRVLDLCGAPGGKSTELGAKLLGQGVLVANDLSNSRAKALLRNLERFGVENAVVISESPEKLLNFFPEYFDKILIDAPCSGEGMFHKDGTMTGDWELKGPDYYSSIQKGILKAAIAMLRPGGCLLYSTCTFSPKENEEIIAWLLDQEPSFSVLPIPQAEGMDRGHPEWADGREELKGCVRLWPFQVKGQGHFAALLRKNNSIHKEDLQAGALVERVSLPSQVLEFFRQMNLDVNQWTAHKETKILDNRIYLVPKGMPDLKGLRILRSGLLLGELKKDRFEPAQAFAMCIHSEEGKGVHLSDYEEAVKYLKGETLFLEDEKKAGWQLVRIDGFPLGWAKAQKGTLKNKYAAGWRWQ